MVVRNLTRKSMALLTSLLLVLFWVPGLIAATPANAANNPPPAPAKVVGGFEIDGDFVANNMPTPADDWNNVSVVSTSDPTGTADTTNFSGGSKECTSGGDCSSDNWTGATGTAPNKADISNVYVSTRLRPNVSDSTKNDVWGYFGLTRVDNSGSVFYDIELNQAANHIHNGISVPTRTDKDVLIILDQNGNGDFSFSGTIQKWVAANDPAACQSGLVKPCWGVQTSLSGLGVVDFYGRSNSGTIAGYQNSGTLADDLFGEVAVNLTAAGAILGCPSTGFTKMNVRSKASPGSPTASDGDVTGSAEIKDYVAADVAIPSACGELVINKYGPGTSTTHVPGATFTIDPNPIPGQTGTLTIRDADTGANADGNGDGIIDIDPATPGTYTVTETVPPPGYFLPAVTEHDNVVVTAFGSGANATVTDFHDPLGSITVTKTGSGGSLAGSQFTLTGPDSYSTTVLDAASGTNSDGTADGTLTWTNLKKGTYTLHEDSAPTGYDTVADQTFVIQDSVVDSHHGRDLSVTIDDPQKTTSLSVHKFHTETDLSKTDIQGAVFNLYQTDSGTPPATFTAGMLVGSCTTDVNGLCSVGDATHIVTWHHFYYWVEQSVPWPYSVPADNVFGPVEITADNVSATHPITQADDPKAGITTTATASVTMPLAAGTGISDVAHVSGLSASAAGTVLFQAYGPDSACTGTPAFTSNYISSYVTVSGHRDYTSNVFTPTVAGTYKWVATYYPDFNGTTGSKANFVAGACTDDGETSVVHPAQPAMTTSATDTNTVDGAFHDTATLTGFAPTPAGMSAMQVTFTLYTDNSCTHLAPTGTVNGVTNATNTWTVDVVNGAATSGDYHATNSTATYYWKATLTGNTNNGTDNITDDCGSTTGGNHEVSNAPILDAPHKYNSPGTEGPGLTATDPHVSIYANNNQITYTITETNSGAADMTGVQVTDTVSSLATYNAGSIQCLADATSCVMVDNTAPALKWTFNLAAGKTATLKFSVTVKSSDLRTDIIENQAHATNGSVTRDSEITQNPLAYPNLSINKCASPLPNAIVAGSNPDCNANAANLVAPGSAIVYALTVTNNGNADATGVAVTDAVPPHTSYSSCDNSCTAPATASDPVTWSLTVPAGHSLTVHFTVNVDANATDTTKIDNTASFTWSNSGGETADQSGTSATIEHLVGVPIISGNKFADPLPTGDPIPDSQNTADGIVHPGDTITYTIQATNDGLAQKQITITDQVPDGTTYSSGAKCDDAAVTCSFDGASGSPTVLQWTLTLPGNSSTTVSFPVTVNANDSDTQVITNFANVDNQKTREIHHEVEFPIIGAVKSSDPSYVSGAPTLVGPNTVIKYTITVTNTGHQAKSGVVVTDAVPSGTTYDSSAPASCDSTPNCTVDTSGLPTSLKWTLDMPAGSVESPAVATVSFSVITPDVQSALIDNTASYTNVHSDCDTPTCDTNTTHHEVVFPVINAHKTSSPASGTAANPATVTPGQVITYTVAVDNSGQADATGVHVSDVVPNGVTYVQGSADLSGGTYDAGSNTVSWTIDVAKGATTLLTFQAKVPDDATNGTLIDNTATFSNVHTPNCLSAGETSCNTETTHHEVRFPVLTLAKSSNPVSGSIVQRGDRIDYTITLTNTGLDGVQKTVTDTLPDHVTLVGGSAVPAFTTVNGNVVTWTVNVPPATVGDGGNVPGTVVLTYSVTVDNDAPQGATLTNVALVNGECVGNADASACTTDHHVPTGALTLVKHVDKATASYGDTLTYTFDAGTTGALDQTAVVVTDVLPKGTAYVAGSAKCTDAGTCAASFDNTSKTVTWQLGDMAAGATRHLVFKVTIVTPAFDSTVGLPPATIVNSGVIASTETPKTPSNQVVTKVVAVLGVKVVRPPRLPFTGVPAQEMLMAGLFLLGAGIILTSVRRREQ